jgi:hypothetical protein
MEIVNETFILLVTYMFMALSDLSTDIKDKFVTGYFICGFVTLYLFVNTGLLTYKFIT